MAGREVGVGSGWQVGNGGALSREWRGREITNDMGETAYGARMADGGA